MTKRFTLPGKRLEDYREHLESKSQLSDVQGVTTDISLSKLQPAPWNARRHFNPQALEDLAKDLKTNGQIHPLLVRPLGGNFEVVVGERRYRAALIAGLDSLKAHVRELDNRQAQRISLSENLEREDLNPYEETTGILSLLALEFSEHSEFQVFKDPQESLESATTRLLYRYLNETQAATNNVISSVVMGSPLEVSIKAVFGRTRMTWQSYIQNRLPLLKLPSDILEALREGRLEYTKARAISKVKDSTVRQVLLEATLEENLSLAGIRERKEKLEVQEPDEQHLQASLTEAESTLQTAQAIRNKLKPASIKRLAPEKQEELRGLLERIDEILEK